MYFFIYDVHENLYLIFQYFVYDSILRVKDHNNESKYGKNKHCFGTKPLTNPKKISILLVHTTYYRNFIRHYSNITFPLDELLENDIKFSWSIDYQELVKVSNNKLVEATMLRFSNWSKKFHVHVDASNIIVKALLSQPRKDNIDHPNFYTNWELNNVERNYSIIERVGLGMIFELHNLDTTCCKFHLY
jgi:hypothetical protein